jgi:hypothetical protein
MSAIGTTNGVARSRSESSAVATNQKAGVENEVLVEVARSEAADEIGERVSVQWDPNDAIVLTT